MKNVFQPLHPLLIHAGKMGEDSGLWTLSLPLRKNLTFLSHYWFHRVYLLLLTESGLEFGWHTSEPPCWFFIGVNHALEPRCHQDTQRGTHLRLAISSG